MSSRRTTLVAAAAAAAAATIVVYGVYKYRQRRRSGLDVDDTPAVAAAAATQKPAAATEVAATAVPDAQKAELLEEAQRAKDRGNKRFQGRQFPQAIKDYTDAIEKASSVDPKTKNLAVYYGNRAQCYFSMEEYAQAVTDCDASIAVDPKYVKALIRRGSAHEKLGNLDLALIDFTAAGLLSKMQNELAVKGCERVVKEVASAKAQARLAEPMRGLPSTHFISMFVTSFQSIRNAIDAPHRPLKEIDAAKGGASGIALGKLLVERAIALMKLSRYEDAMDTWMEAARLVPWDKSDPLIEEWRKEAEGGKTQTPAMILTIYGMFTHLQGKHDDAMALYDRALEIRPGQTETLAMRASLFYEKQQLPKVRVPPLLTVAVLLAVTRSLLAVTRSSAWSSCCPRRVPHTGRYPP